MYWICEQRLLNYYLDAATEAGFEWSLTPNEEALTVIEKIELSVKFCTYCMVAKLVTFVHIHGPLTGWEVEVRVHSQKSALNLSLLMYKYLGGIIA